MNILCSCATLALLYKALSLSQLGNTHKILEAGLVLLSFTIFTKKHHLSVTFFSSLDEGHRTISSRYQRQDQSKALQILKAWLVSIVHCNLISEECVKTAVAYWSKSLNESAYGEINRKCLFQLCLESVDQDAKVAETKLNSQQE